MYSKHGLILKNDSLMSDWRMTQNISGDDEGCSNAHRKILIIVNGKQKVRVRERARTTEGEMNEAITAFWDGNTN